MSNNITPKKYRRNTVRASKKAPCLTKGSEIHEARPMYFTTIKGKDVVFYQCKDCNAWLDQNGKVSQFQI